MTYFSHHLTILLLATGLVASPMGVSAEVTSRSAPELARVLAANPETDKDKDGILNFDEFDAFARTQGDKKPANPLSIAMNNGDLLITSFEENNLGKMQQWGWKIEGQAFQHDVNAGTNMMKRRVGSFSGRYLLTSFNKSDAMVGRVISPEFEIALPHINFLISGGDFAQRTCVNLVVDGEVVRSATGRNDDQFESVAFAVAEFNGRRAQIEIVDAYRGLWGHVNVDRVVQSQGPGMARVISQRPAQQAVESDHLTLCADSARLQEAGAVKDGLLHVGKRPLTPGDLLMVVCDRGSQVPPLDHALRMIDGEIWKVKKFALDEGKLSIQSDLFGSREVPIDQVASLEFSADLEPITGKPGRLHRTNGEPIPGKLIWVRDKDVAVDCALGILPVPRAIVRSFVLAVPQPAATKSRDEIGLVDGSLLFGKVRFDNDKLVVEHTAHGSLTLPWAAVRHLRRSDGSVTWLDLLEPSVVERRGPALPPPAPLLVESSDSSHLRAIRMMPRTVVHYALPNPPNHSQVLRAQLAPLAGSRADVSVRVLAGDDVLWQKQVGAADAAVPVSVDLPQSGADGLTIEVDFASALAFPCGVEWRDAHVMNTNIATTNPTNQPD